MNLEGKTAALQKEIAPCLEIAEKLFNETVPSLLNQGQPLELAEQNAAYISVLGALSLARKSQSITEDAVALDNVANIFHVFMSAKKLINAGILNARITETKDKTGWPCIQFLGET